MHPAQQLNENARAACTIEVIGLLAGRRKRHWLTERAEVEAHLVRGDLGQAEILCKRASAMTVSPRERTSMYMQAIQVASDYMATRVPT